MAGENFDTLADLFREGGGTVSRTRWIPYGSMPKGVSDLVKVAAPGEVIRYSDQTGDEYVIKVLEKREEGSADFEEIKERVRNKLLQTKRQKALEDWYEVQLKTVKIEYMRDEK